MVLQKKKKLGKGQHTKQWYFLLHFIFLHKDHRDLNQSLPHEAVIRTLVHSPALVLKPYIVSGKEDEVDDLVFTSLDASTPFSRTKFPSVK